jgi:recombination protein RecT
MANTLSVKPQTSLTAYLTGDAVKNQISKVVGGANGDRFISSLMSAVQANPTLQECSNASLVNAALLGYSLNLSPSPQLGYFYFVPFWDNDNTYDERGRIINKKTYAEQKNVAERSLPSVRAAQFQMGYRGYLQLAMRSGQYKKINTVEIKEGEFVSYNPLLEELKVNIIEDPDERMRRKTIGYYAMFEYLNGFRKEMYWTEGQMRAHAQRYSKSYKNGPWATDFDKMAAKTMLRQQIMESMEALDEREREVLILRYGLRDGQPQTLEEVGNKFSVTRERIRQIEARAIKKLKLPSRLKKLDGFI